MRLQAWRTRFAGFAITAAAVALCLACTSKVDPSARCERLVQHVYGLSVAAAEEELKREQDLEAVRASLETRLTTEELERSWVMLAEHFADERARKLDMLGSELEHERRGLVDRCITELRATPQRVSTLECLESAQTMAAIQACPALDFMVTARPVP